MLCLLLNLIDPHVKYKLPNNINMCKKRQLVVKTQIAYLSLGQNFDASLGKGVQKYIYELYVHLRAITKDVKKLLRQEGSTDSLFLNLFILFTSMTSFTCLARSHLPLH